MDRASRATVQAARDRRYCSRHTPSPQGLCPRRVLPVTGWGKRSSVRLMEALRSTEALAFAAEPYDAYEEFITRKLSAEEAPDAFLAALRRLASCFGGVPEKVLACAFMSGLPGNV
ncbi:hypothetical protein TTRE_0000648501 [Trichuris trichiura]|uniref:Uncharacterized protein n=1 Tax=Trichuris trichiura TaxID=36087 RepID=A0A077ZHV5_TRITR|nr:hypothetical protein TTRE_0000648501 [Trichuris trichiura]